MPLAEIPSEVSVRFANDQVPTKELDSIINNLAVVPVPLDITQVARYKALVYDSNGIDFAASKSCWLVKPRTYISCSASRTDRGGIFAEKVFV